jgi:tetratricopeptide (TPR) repeat protein
MVLVLLIPFSTEAKNPIEEFKKANELYQKGNYKEAISLYEAIIRSGFVSAELYYNLGNAYYKTSEIPAAILNYERALKIKPGDADAEFNLKIANSQTIDKIEPLPEVFYKRWLNKWLMSDSPESRFNHGIILLWICLALFACWLFVPVPWIKRVAFLLTLVSLTGSLMFYLVGSWQQKQLKDESYAIIFEPNVYVKSSPDEKSANLFMLHGGTKVKMVDELSGWKRIRLPNGHEGWIPETALEKI